MQAGHRLLPLLILLISFDCLSQATAAGFKKYNWRNIGPYTTSRHQLLLSTNYVIDVTPEEGDPGNLQPGHNVGLGIGYGYKILFDNAPQSITLGTKAEWYPGTMYKFNLLLELDAIIFNLKKNYANAVFLSGLEANYSFNTKFESGGSSPIIYFVEVNVKNVELKWGLQSGTDALFVKPTTWTDWGTSVFKLTYKLNL